MASLRHSFWHALEWRLFGYLITIAYLLATGEALWYALVNGFGLQVALFVGHIIWLKLRTRISSVLPRRLSGEE